MKLLSYLLIVLSIGGLTVVMWRTLAAIAVLDKALGIEAKEILKLKRAIEQLRLDTCNLHDRIEELKTRIAGD